MKSTALLLVCMVGAALAATSVYSPPANKDKIFLQNEVIDTSKQLPDMVLSTAAEDEAPRVYLVQLSTHCKYYRASLEEKLSIKFFGYIPENTYMTYCNPNAAALLSSEKNVKFVGELSSSNKVASNIELSTVPAAKSLKNELLGIETEAKPETVTLSANVAAGADVEEVVSQLRKVKNVQHAQKSGSSLVHFTVSTPAAVEVAGAAAKLNSIVYVERVLDTKVHNKHAQGLLQSNDESRRPLSEAGLFGEGEIVGVGDTGVDAFRCAFNDDKNEPTYITDPEKPLKDNGHRKIKGYWALQDDLDYPQGHGTHVSGSILGAVHKKDSAKLAQYNGGAPLARLVMTDIGCIKDGGCACTNPKYCPAPCVQMGGCPANPMATFTPPDLNEGYFPWAYEAGARIHSNSWGAGSDTPGFGGMYDGSSAQIDQFVHEHPDMLILFAAGNSGALGFYSIGSQGISKNVLTVGATHTTNNGFVDSADYDDYDGIVEQLNMAAKQMGLDDQMDGPSDCCDPNIDKKHPGICALVQRKLGDCRGLANLCCPQVAKKGKIEQYKQEVLWNDQNMADFSSLGMSRDGRIKPDVVSPGHSIISVRSQGTLNAKKCGDPESKNPDEALLTMSGTSMATPNMAGQAALVREYYRKGFFPSGKASSGDEIMPSAALLKATIINSGRAIQGMMGVPNAFVPLAAGVGLVPQTGFTPAIGNAVQGFGRPWLEKTLPLQLKDHKSAKMILGAPHGNGKKYADPKVDEGETVSRCFMVHGDSEELKVTMVYTDPPAQPQAGRYLVNDLDLLLARVEDKNIWPGNQLSAIDPVTGQLTYIADSANNVEQVAIGKPEKGLYVVNVEGKRVPMGPQDFALVITGDVTETPCQGEVVFQTTVDNRKIAVSANSPKNLFLVAFGGVGVAVVAAAIIAIGFAYYAKSRQQPNTYSRADSLLA